MTIYNVLEQDIDIWTYVFLWPIITISNFVIFRFVKIKSNENVWYRFVIPSFTLFFFVFVCFRQAKTLRHFKKKIENNEVEILQGVITEYNSIKYGIKGFESFEIDKRLAFKYPAQSRDYVGYAITKRNGSILEKGMKIKIWHVQGRILRIDKLD